MRREITAILLVASSDDEVIVILNSAGGTIQGYGLAASQLSRIRDKGITLTVCIDSLNLFFEYDGNKFIKSGFHYNSDHRVIAQGCLECSWNTEI